jgi:hypothetical protein
MTRLKEYIGILFLALILVFTFHPGAAQAAGKLPIITQLGCPLGCGSVTGYTMLGNYIAKEDLGFILRPQETPGYTYNIREMARNEKRWPNTVFETEDNLIALADTAGGTPALKEFLPERIPGPWKAIMSAAVASQGTWWITFDPELKKIADLKGKKLGLGLKTQVNWGQDTTFLLNQGYGINAKNTKLLYLGPAKMTEALLNRQVDAICMGLLAKNQPGDKTWLPSSVYRKLEASGRKLYYIPAEPKVIDKINKKFNSYWGIETVKAGTLKFQEADIIVAVSRPLLAVHPTFSEDLAYRYVKAIASLAPVVAEFSGLWKYVWDLDGMVCGLTENNTHPGAIKAYKELGLWEKRKNYKPFPF